MSSSNRVDTTASGPAMRGQCAALFESLSRENELIRDSARTAIKHAVVETKQRFSKGLCV